MSEIMSGGIPSDSVYAAKTSARQREMAGAPVMVKSSLYKNEYLNWGGTQKPLVEKTPQYPFYSLPFRGKSEYKERFKNDENKEPPKSAKNQSTNKQHSKSTQKLYTSKPVTKESAKTTKSSAVIATAEYIKKR